MVPMDSDCVKRKLVAWLIVLVIFFSVVSPFIIHPLYTWRWNLGLWTGAIFSSLSVFWYALDCRCLQVRIRWWLMLGAATIPFISIPVHRFLVTGVTKGAHFLGKLIGFILIFLSLNFLLYSSLDEFCEPAVFGNRLIDGGEYFQFWGC